MEVRSQDPCLNPRYSLLPAAAEKSGWRADWGNFGDGVGISGSPMLLQQTPKSSQVHQVLGVLVRVHNLATGVLVRMPDWPGVIRNSRAGG